jgi:hypothetical protein
VELRYKSRGIVQTDNTSFTSQANANSEFHKQVYNCNSPVSKPTTVNVFPQVMLICSNFPAFWDSRRIPTSIPFHNYHLTGIWSNWIKKGYHLSQSKEKKHLHCRRRVPIAWVNTRGFSVVGRACLPAKDTCRIVATCWFQWKCNHTWFYHKESIVSFCITVWFSHDHEPSVTRNPFDKYEKVYIKASHNWKFRGPRKEITNR